MYRMETPFAVGGAGQAFFAKKTSSKKEWSAARFVVLATIFLVFFRDVFGGALRYYFFTLGAGGVWFLPDLLLLVSVPLAYLFSIKKEYKISIYIFFVAMVFGVLVGLYVSGSALAVVSGVKMVLPLFFGMIVGRFRYGDLMVRRVLWVFFFVSCLGVFLNQYIDYPWTDFTVPGVDGEERSAGRLWWINAEARLGGFATDSTQAAFNILLPLLIFCATRRSRFFWLMLPIGAYSIHLTTSRTALVVLGFIVFYVFVCRVLLRRSRRSQISFHKFFVGLLSLSPFVVPLLSVIFFATLFPGGDVPYWLTSYQERATSSWVKPFQFINDNFPLGFIFGLGFGTTGYPVLFSRFGEGYLIPYDNFPLGIYMQFGVFGFLLLVYFVLDVLRRKKSCSIQLIVSGLLLYVVTIQGFGSASLCAALGVAIAYQPRSIFYRVGTSKNLAPPAA